MRRIDTVEDLHALYGTPGKPALRKVATRLTPLYRRWIMASRFCILSTVGPEGTDGSPRGDDGPVVAELDDTTLLMPDWRGNNRLDSLRNIVRDGRVSLMFMVPPSNTVVRVNGTAYLTDDDDLRHRFEQRGKHPATVIVIEIAEIYTQCAKALLRSDLWARDDREGLPTTGDILADMTDGEEGGPDYEANYNEYAMPRMW
ncbi:pyridoxamine 5'-phosphate oxidase family protein [Pseudaestuariivita atlantica]|uniref:Pyridoxamine 5'-phosphate oxidase n=1 Tax=Pseudaestuariivita atlantica TaxID=1317121 RepID=A0A0L1JRM5_9RHOB|nr:pyridoxamine 5'-phosphate oxidase family protein [Pseudaestuariivita atlantica]KNG94396.1 pyridoxamine 5'-phosphate oxidase [Pseudaestuariivita atlantica]